METLINFRSAARLAAASAIVLSLAPVTAAATTAPAAHPPRYDLCDGHRWSLFGCRSEHHGVRQPEADDLSSGSSSAND
jgi:hypothetical protein